MKIYISGKIGGLPLEEVQIKFGEAEAALIGEGYEVVNPLKNGLPFTSPWERHMAKDIVLLMECDAVYMLPDWQHSRGATIEKHIAEITHKHIIHKSHD